MTDSSVQVGIVLHPFAAYTKGDVIRDAAAIAAIRRGGQSSQVVFANIPAGPEAPIATAKARS